MKEKNFARKWLAIIFAFVGLVMSLPASYYFQSQLFRTMYEMQGHSVFEYVASIPGLFLGKNDPDDRGMANFRNTVVWTAIGFVVCGYVAGLVIKLIIAASQRAEEPAKAS
jgi:hypothetical protein